jgi:hypothetical protein
MTKGGPNDSTNFVSYYAYQLFDQARYGEATAMATILFAIVIGLSLTAYRIGDREPGKNERRARQPPAADRGLRRGDPHKSRCSSIPTGGCCIGFPADARHHV